jgi:hypothetical protein
VTRFLRAWLRFRGPGRFLCKQDDFAEAKAVLSRGLERFPGSKPLMINWCWTLHLLREWPAALEAWGALSRAHPAEWLAILGGAATLRQMNGLMTQRLCCWRRENSWESIRKVRLIWRGCDRAEGLGGCD